MQVLQQPLEESRKYDVNKGATSKDDKIFSDDL